MKPIRKARQSHKNKRIIYMRFEVGKWGGGASKFENGLSHFRRNITNTSIRNVTN